MKKIGIFCSASENIDKMYFDSARQIGEWMGKAGKTLIYGGANLGLMECVARAVKENGGTIIGVVPAKLEEKGSVSTLLDEVIHTRNLSDRKDVITEKSEILVALPGGVGTLDEIFHVIAAASIGYHQKKVIFYNEYGFYNELLAALKTLEDKGFARQSFSTYYETANNLDELKEKAEKELEKINSIELTQKIVAECLYSINKEAKRKRDIQHNSIDRAYHSFRKEYPAAHYQLHRAKNEKFKLYDLKDEALHLAIDLWNLQPVGYHEFPDANRDMYSLEGYDFHINENISDHCLGKITEESKVTVRTNHTKPRTNIVDCRCYSSKVRYKIMAFK